MLVLARPLVDGRGVDARKCLHRAFGQAMCDSQGGDRVLVAGEIDFRELGDVGLR
jgi:hypothetical protein